MHDDDVEAKIERLILGLADQIRCQQARIAEKQAELGRHLAAVADSYDKLIELRLLWNQIRADGDGCASATSPRMSACCRQPSKLPVQAEQLRGAVGDGREALL